MQYPSLSYQFLSRSSLFFNYRKKMKSCYFSLYCWFLPADWPGIISCAILFLREVKNQLLTAPYFRITKYLRLSQGKITTVHNKLRQKEGKEENRISRNGDISSETFRKKRQHQVSAYLIWFTSSLTVRWY